MHKTTIPQQQYNPSNIHAKYMTNDHLTFINFLDPEIGNKIPDDNTI
jgi:hypothetical protein